MRAPNVRFSHFIYAVAACLLPSLTWPSMCCIYVTKSAMLIFKEKKKQNANAVEKITLRIACAYSFACMHAMLNAAKKCSWTLILLGISIAKKSFLEKKTIRTLPRGMNTMKRTSRCLVWTHTHSRIYIHSHRHRHTCMCVYAKWSARKSIHMAKPAEWSNRHVRYASKSKQMQCKIRNKKLVLLSSLRIEKRILNKQKVIEKWE